jgi:hypothetical protein
MKTNNSKRTCYIARLRKATKPIAFCITILFILSPLLLLDTPTVQGAMSKVSVSSATASSYDGVHTPSLAIDGVDAPDYWGTNGQLKLPQWLQLDLGSQISISQIVTHFYDGSSRTYTYYIQVSNDASTWTTVVQSKAGVSLVTDTINPVTARYVRIAVTGNTANSAAHIQEVSIYQSTTSTVVPNPTNYASILNGWHLVFGKNLQFAFFDYSVTHNGNPSIRVQADYVGSRELNTDPLPVKPGDHIVFGCWIKTGHSSTGKDGNDWFGGRIGVDMYCDGHILASVPFGDEEGHRSWVAFNTDTWTYRQYDFIIPTTWFSKDTIGQTVSPTQQISTIIPWIQVFPQTDTGQVWYADSVLQINP